MAMPVIERAKNVVVDAGGLLPRVLDVATDVGAELVLTPHAGEFQRIAGVGGGAYSVRALAARVGGVVLLKGNPNLISDGGPPVLVNTGGPELATIGTGDVLAGMIAALWARGASSMEAALTGAYFHGKAGADLKEHSVVTAAELAYKIQGYAF
jgi:NAD(P)H-hydrate repair Nnr-like enzyme with NAD(P)H-hydrate dehydratase domain